MEHLVEFKYVARVNAPANASEQEIDKLAHEAYGQHLKDTYALPVSAWADIDEVIESMNEITAIIDEAVENLSVIDTRKIGQIIERMRTDLKMLTLLKPNCL